MKSLHGAERRSTVATLVALLCVLFFLAANRAVAVHGSSPLRSPSDMYPGSALVTWRPNSVRPYIIVDGAIYTIDLRLIMRFAPPKEMNAEYARWDRSGTHLLLGDKDSLVTIDFARRQVTQSTVGSSAVVVDACWTSSGVLRVMSHQKSEQSINIGKQTIRVPNNVRITAVNNNGTCFIGWEKHEPEDTGRGIDAILAFRNAQTGIEIRKVNSISLPVSVVNPYGEQVLVNGHEIVITQGGTGMKDYTYGDLDSVDDKNLRAFPLTKLGCYIQSRLALFNGHVYGMMRDEHALRMPTPPPVFYRVVIRDRKVDLRRLRDVCIGYAHSEDSNREAYVERQGRELFIRVYASGRIVAERRFILPKA